MNWKSFDVAHPDSHRECLVWGYYQLPDGARIRITCPAVYSTEFKIFTDRDGDDIEIDVTHWIDYREITGPSTNKQ